MTEKITFSFKRQEHSGFGFPYIPETREDGINYGYVDLKKYPEAIDTLPELSGFPELVDMIRRLNSPESVFRTVGCDTGALDLEFEQYTKKVGCYVHIAFEEFEYNVEQKYYDLIFGGLYYHVQEQYDIKGRAHIFGTLKPTRFQDYDGLPGYTLQIDISGLGTSEAEGRAAWAEVMPTITNGFERISRGWEEYKLQAKDVRMEDYARSTEDDTTNAE